VPPPGIAAHSTVHQAEAQQWSDPNKNKAGGEHMPSIDAIQSALKQSQGEGYVAPFARQPALSACRVPNHALH
jgi:hypothetical protein